MDSALAGFVLFEQVEGDAIENGEVLGGVAGAFAVEVFAKADIEHPVQLVLDAPVLTNGAVQTRRIGFETGDGVAGFGLGFARGLGDSAPPRCALPPVTTPIRKLSRSTTGRR